MTAIRAPRSALRGANPFPPTSPASPVEVRLPGSARTYEARDVLRGVGLRWDPATHAWHGRLRGEQRAFLERRLGLTPRAVVPIEAFAELESPPAAPHTALASPPPTAPRPPVGPRGPPRDYSRTRVEARVALPGPADEPVEFATPTRTFSLDEITSGLPDDSREAGRACRGAGA